MWVCNIDKTICNKQRCFSLLNPSFPLFERIVFVMRLLWMFCKQVGV